MASRDELSRIALERRIAAYGLDPAGAEALRSACIALQKALQFCPRYHGEFNCAGSGRRCPKVGCQWTCWFDGYLERAGVTLKDVDA